MTPDTRTGDFPLTNHLFGYSVAHGEASADIGAVAPAAPVPRLCPDPYRCSGLPIRPTPRNREAIPGPAAAGEFPHFKCVRFGYNRAEEQ
jgi:hypothetical protein